MKPTVYIIQAPPFWLKTPPLALIYLENYLKQQGINAGVVDLNIELFKLSGICAKEWLHLDKNFEEGLFSQVEKKYPQVLDNLYAAVKDTRYVGLSIFKRNAAFAFSLAQRLSEKFPHIKIIFGGPEALFLDWKDKLQSPYTWVIGEGELPLFEAVNGAKSGTYRFREVDDLDSLPFLDFDAVKLKSYSAAIPLLSSRGCIFNCAFCSEKKLYKKFRHHSGAYLVDEMQYLKNKYNSDTFVFCDSMINYDNTWLDDFCTRLIKTGLNIKWEAQMRVDEKFSPELAGIMKKSGCYNLFVGLESASDKVLRSMHKGFTAAHALDFFAKLENAALQFEVSLIFGYPGETQQDFRETLNFIVQNKKRIPKIAQANAFVDYMDVFDAKFPSEEAEKRIKIFLKTLQEEKIKYTRSFIGNLVYEK
ncbi:MAG: radical SAM protein [Candidatus Omnitrophica bacterium]|nr:radical SAM protein [Candidatus Omnitrophota bacterium]